MLPLWAIFVAVAVAGGLALIDHYLPSQQHCRGVPVRLAQAERLLQTPGLKSQDYLHAERWRDSLKAEQARCGGAPSVNEESKGHTVTEEQ